jgi:hypothetical protein
VLTVQQMAFLWSQYYTPLELLSLEHGYVTIRGAVRLKFDEVSDDEEDSNRVTGYYAMHEPQVGHRETMFFRDVVVQFTSFSPEDYWMDRP